MSEVETCARWCPWLCPRERTKFDWKRKRKM